MAASESFPKNLREFVCKKRLTNVITCAILYIENVLECLQEGL